jgi:hypothetical protein
MSTRCSLGAPRLRYSAPSGDTHEGAIRLVVIPICAGRLSFLTHRRSRRKGRVVLSRAGVRHFCSRLSKIPAYTAANPEAVPQPLGRRLRPVEPAASIIRASRASRSCATTAKAVRRPLAAAGPSFANTLHQVEGVSACAGNAWPTTPSRLSSRWPIPGSPLSDATPRASMTDAPSGISVGEAGDISIGDLHVA